MFALKEPVGTDWRVDTGDITNTKRALSLLGYYTAPPERGIDDWADTQMFDGIRAFQIDNGLKVDAFMRPGGPTEKAISHLLQTSRHRDDNDGVKAGPFVIPPQPPHPPIRMPPPYETPVLRPQPHKPQPIVYPPVGGKRG